MAALKKLITPEEVISISIIDTDMENASIKEAAIDIAQEEHIFPVIGDKLQPTESLYDEIVSQNDTGNLSADNKILLEDYIKPALAYFVKYEILEDIHIRAGSQGIQENFSQFGSSVSSAARSDLSKRVKSNANTLIDKMVRFLEDNLDLYPKYNSGLNVVNRSSVKGGLILGGSDFDSKFTTKENER